jgi:hypothetical protein
MKEQEEKLGDEIPQTPEVWDTPEEDWDYYDDDDEDNDDDGFEDEYEEAMGNCGMMGDGMCMYIGSEDCDFCPFHNEMFEEEE